MFWRRRSAPQPSLTMLVTTDAPPTFDGDDSLRRSAMELGSITKALTGIVVADLDRLGRLPLDAAVHEVLDLDRPLRTRDDAVVTVEDLATHHAGLPRLGDLGQVDNADPYRAIDGDDVLSQLQRCTDRPGRRRYEYSNLGYAVLGLCIARVAGSWERAMSDHLLEPLGLDGVWAGPAPAGIERAEGRDRRGRPASWWTMSGYSAAGAVTATGEGTAALLAALLDRSRDGGDATPVGAAVRAATNPRRTLPGGHIGLGWHIDTNGLVWHNGGTGGFSSFAALDSGRTRATARLAVGPPDPRAERRAAALLG